MGNQLFDDTRAGDTHITAGVYTSEFWIAVLVIVTGTVLLAIGAIDQDTWKWAVSIPAAGYALSRGIAKN